MRRAKQAGSVLLIALFFLVVLGGAVAALAPLAMTERLLATATREAAECRYAAAAVVAYAVSHLQDRVDWSGALQGTDVAPFADASRRPVFGGSRTEDLDAAAAGLPAMERGTWGADEPSWSLFAWGPARGLALPALPTGIYVAAWVADDERDGDRDPRRDSNGRLSITGRAFGPVRGTCTAAAIVGRDRPWPAALRLVDWRAGG